MKRIVLLIALAVAAACGLPNHAQAQPDYWDPRLDDLGIFWYPAGVEAGTWYWKLVRGEFENEQQAQGRHHVYYRCMDPDGNFIENQKTWACWPTANPRNFVWQLTKGRLDGWWGNFAMSGGNWCPPYPVGPVGPFGAFVDFEWFISDSVWGMGLPCNRHVAYRFTWQLVLAE